MQSCMTHGALGTQWYTWYTMVHVFRQAAGYSQSSGLITHTIITALQVLPCTAAASAPRRPVQAYTPPLSVITGVLYMAPQRHPHYARATAASLVKGSTPMFHVKFQVKLGLMSLKQIIPAQAGSGSQIIPLAEPMVAPHTDIHVAVPLVLSHRTPAAMALCQGHSAESNHASTALLARIQRGEEAQIWHCPCSRPAFINLLRDQLASKAEQYGQV